jgi:uncharacterized protein
MRVVFDTNVFISALTLPGGRADDAIIKIIDSEDTLVISREIIDEVLTILARKFSKDAEALSRVAVNLAGIGELVSPSEKLAVLDDEADNCILECAVAGKAEAIVTGDKAMLMLKRYQNIKIIALSGYLD